MWQKAAFRKSACKILIDRHKKRQSGDKASGNVTPVLSLTAFYENDNADIMHAYVYACIRLSK